MVVGGGIARCVTLAIIAQIDVAPVQIPPPAPDLSSSIGVIAQRGDGGAAAAAEATRQIALLSCSGGGEGRTDGQEISPVE